MSTNLRNTAAYLRVQRLFPSDNPQALAVELDRSYVDIANAVNSRIIATFTVNVQSVNGESWFFEGGNRRRQGLRQVYEFTGIGNIPHGLNISTILISPKSCGDFTDGTNWYGANFDSNTPLAGQVSFYVDPANIVIVAGAGAPSITSGIIVLEWISQV